jgi:Zn finger protein HypA/HybF involved in hydrogenase expression
MILTQSLHFHLKLIKKWLFLVFETKLTVLVSFCFVEFFENVSLCKISKFLEIINQNLKCLELDQTIKKKKQLND